ncbi:carboxymuconolactone decarboxylase family protein [Reichenbachiella sp.]|uniref:carboxymuconolactone decarboxylase family protein n=1 Tax=Reichenbachiella sp. TaxID=2184521 RepID=UPI003B5B5002
MAWIKEIDYDDSKGKLRKIYDRIKGPGDYIDNILKVHSLRPYSLEGHMALYKYVLHNSTNETPVHFLEALGVYVSMLNKCSYCVDHHYQGMKKLLKDDEKSEKIHSALKNDKPEMVFSSNESAVFSYAKKLTLNSATMTKNDIVKLRNAGLADGEILEINQVVSYFCYANRTVLGLGVSTDGDILGLSPNDQTDEDNWTHS